MNPPRQSLLLALMHQITGVGLDGSVLSPSLSIVTLADLYQVVRADVPM